MTANQPDKKQFGKRHWLLQAIPPSLILLTLFSTRSGTALVFIVGFFVIPVLVSLVSILFKLLDFRNRKFFLVRPVLTIVFFFMVIAIAQISYSTALEQATEAATILHEQCNTNGVCPAQPEGWIVNERRISRRDLGGLYKYTASYYYEPYSFSIRVYQGPDLGEVIRGGVGVPFRVDPYVEN